MFCSKMISTLAAILFLFGISTVDYSLAGEKQKMKSHGASYTTTVHQIKVGDDEGHVLVIWENKAVYFNEINGMRTADTGVAFADINPVTGEMSVQGYGVNVDKDGDKMIRTYVGKPVAKDQWKGTWTIKTGTGKYKGAKGGGTWTSYNLAPNQGYTEAEGEWELP
jgi:hypothetical protein